MSHKIGDLVKWQAVYDDYLVKDVGLGIIMGIKEYKYEKNKYCVYDVYRTEHKDILSLGNEHLEKI
jgi:hypothetical protein|tara:strand:- start:958 stop:1155 length:198 start_codon:yes stop_codon:yes gene_type:complete